MWFMIQGSFWVNHLFVVTSVQKKGLEWNASFVLQIEKLHLGEILMSQW